MRTTFIASALAVLLGLATAEPAMAYRYRVCNALGASENINFPSNTATLRSSTTSFPVGEWLDGLNSAISLYNKNPSPFRLARVDDTGGLGIGNGQNEVWGSTEASVLQGAPAIAYTYTECYWFFGVVANITEGDTAFDYNSPFQWTPTRNKSAISTYTGTKRLLQGTALHEFGHVAGLLHENRFYNVMGADFTHLDTTGATVNAYMGENAGNGLVALYGLNGSGIQDLGAAHWRFTGASGEYSMHGRTRIFNTSNVELSKSFVGAEPRYNVTRGNSVNVEFTYENLGKNTQNGASIKFYISTNDTISTGDTQIASYIVNLARDTPATTSRAVTIPANLLAATDYWLGVIVTPPVGVADGNSANNTSYIRIRTN